jgi:hypothetical protein
VAAGLVLTLVLLTPGELRTATGAPARPDDDASAPAPRQDVAPQVLLAERPEPRPGEGGDPGGLGDLATAPLPVQPSRPALAAPDQPPAEFVISSFNVLGSSHTRGGDRRSWMGPGTSRIRNVVDLIDRHDVSIAGLQELQRDQFRVFTEVTDGSFGVYPGLSAGLLGVDNSVVWRTADWSLESANLIRIPYFAGRLRPMPYVLLRHTESGRRVWVGNFHNPATNGKRGNNDRWRVQAAALQTRLARTLLDTGYPVFVVGDMNDRERYFCRLTAGAPMQAANGGSNDGACRPPEPPMPVDWIFGSDDVRFTGYARDFTPLVRRTTDHPMVRAGVRLDGRVGLD